MRAFAAVAALLALAACSDEPTGKAPKPSGPSQIDAVTFGLDSRNEGERLFGQKCAFCHVGRNTGTIMLQRRLEADQPAELNERKDLSAEYVKAVVRNGIVNMPPISRVEVSDEELDAIATWLAKGNP